MRIDREINMNNITVIDARDKAKEVALLVKALLIELEPSAKNDIENSGIEKTAKDLLGEAKIWAFIAKSQDENISVITLHECAAIYAGGLFGEISELYVTPKFRSSNIGALLISSAMELAKELGWNRLEV